MFSIDFNRCYLRGDLTAKERAALLLQHKPHHVFTFSRIFPRCFSFPHVLRTAFLAIQILAALVLVGSELPAPTNSRGAQASCAVVKSSPRLVATLSELSPTVEVRTGDRKEEEEAGEEGGEKEEHQEEKKEEEEEEEASCGGRGRGGGGGGGVWKIER